MSFDRFMNDREGDRLTIEISYKNPSTEFAKHIL